MMRLAGRGMHVKKNMSSAGAKRECIERKCGFGGWKVEGWAACWGCPVCAKWKCPGLRGAGGVVPCAGSIIEKSDPAPLLAPHAPVLGFTWSHALRESCVVLGRYFLQIFLRQMHIRPLHGWRSARATPSQNESVPAKSTGHALRESCVVLGRYSFGRWTFGRRVAPEDIPSADRHSAAA